MAIIGNRKKDEKISFKMLSIMDNLCCHLKSYIGINCHKVTRKIYTHTNIIHTQKQYTCKNFDYKKFSMPKIDTIKTFVAIFGHLLLYRH